MGENAGSLSGIFVVIIKIIIIIIIIITNIYTG